MYSSRGPTTQSTLLVSIDSPSCVNERNRLVVEHGKAPVTPGLRQGYDLPATEKWANRRKNVRLVAEAVRLVAEVVGDRKGQISRNKVDGHVQNLKPASPNRKRAHD